MATSDLGPRAHCLKEAEMCTWALILHILYSMVKYPYVDNKDVCLYFNKQKRFLFLEWRELGLLGRQRTLTMDDLVTLLEWNIHNECMPLRYY